MNRSLRLCLGILCLISKEGNGYSPSPDTGKAVCKLSTNSSLWEQEHFSSSLIISQSYAFYLHLPNTCSPPNPLSPILLHSHIHSLTPLLSSFPRVCSPSIIFSTPFPERRHARYGDKKVMIKARLCWKSFLPVSRIQSISFLFG